MDDLFVRRYIFLQHLGCRCLAKIVIASFEKAVAILPSTANYPQRLFCRELFVIGQSK